jgi:hypothetical protein
VGLHRGRLLRCAHLLGGQGSYRRARHVVAFACAPIALSLFLVWPIGIAAFGGDLFRSGGSDSGTGGEVLFWAAVAAGVWGLMLLAIGIRAVHGWTWARSLATLAIAAVPVLGLVALATL